MIDRVALFVTCLADTLFPEVGKATVTVLERLGIEVVFPRRADVLRPDARELGLSRRGASARARGSSRSSRRYEAVVTPSGSCAAQVREHVPGLLEGDDRGVPARTWELSQFLTGVLGVEDVGSTFAGTVTYHPTCHSLRLLAGRRRAAAAARAPCAGSSSWSFREAEECCGFGGTFAVKNADVSAAMLDEKLAAIAASGAGARLRMRQLLPDAHRRRPAPPRLGRARRPPRGDPGVVSGGRPATPGRRPSRRRRAAALANAPAAGEHPARDRRRSAPSAPPSSPRCPTGRSFARRCGGDQGRDARTARRGARRARGVGAGGRAAPCTGRATQPRRTRSSSSSCSAEGADEVVKVKSLATDEIRLNEALEAAGIRPIETDLAELIIQLAGERPSHLLVPGDPQEPAPRSATSSASASGCRTSRTTRPSSPRRRGSTCARRSCGRGSRSRARTSPPPTPARSASSSRRATAACARRCPRC